METLELEEVDIFWFVSFNYVGWWRLTFYADFDKSFAVPSVYIANLIVLCFKINDFVLLFKIMVSY